MTAALWGAFSDGLITTVLPAAMAPMAGPKVSWKGKFDVLGKKPLLVSLALVSPLFRNLRNLSDYQHAAEGILADLGAHEFKGELDFRGLLILHPFKQITSGEDNVVEQPAALGDFSLEAWLVQVPICSSWSLMLQKTSIYHSPLLRTSYPSTDGVLLTPSIASGVGRDGTHIAGLVL
ncbi:hypothetical protein BJX65DRAFT_271650 [Aspergillus insuetus]